MTMRSPHGGLQSGRVRAALHYASKRRLARLKAKLARRRYWRILFTAQGSFDGAGIVEIEFYLSVNGTNIASDGTPISGENAFSSASASAFNGSKDDDVFWGADGINSDSWIGYDFDRLVTITEFEITSRQGSESNQVPDAFSLQSSMNGTDWVTVRSYTDEVDWNENESRKYRVVK